MPQPFLPSPSGSVPRLPRAALALAPAPGVLILLAGATAQGAQSPAPLPGTGAALVPVGAAALAVLGALFALWVARLLRPERDLDAGLDPMRDTAAPASPELRRLSGRAKRRMTRIRARARASCPQMLPEIATYEAMLNRLLRALAAHPEGLPQVRQHLEGELAALETAGDKLSVVLGSAAEDDAAGSFRFALVQMTGEAASCLAGLRAMGSQSRRPEPGIMGGASIR